MYQSGGGVAGNVPARAITQYIQSGGFHTVEISSTTIGVIQASVDIYGLLKSL